ncbi:hypothetical protein B0H11DRAFT_1907508 [Mycena galericulata]|nr:hypothetical protein B0H11DRAFT_1907508 [Mycena galericulata]
MHEFLPGNATALHPKFSSNFEILEHDWLGNIWPAKLHFNNALGIDDPDSDVEPWAAIPRTFTGPGLCHSIALHPSSKLEYIRINKFSKTAISTIETKLRTQFNLYRERADAEENEPESNVVWVFLCL